MILLATRYHHMPTKELIVKSLHTIHPDSLCTKCNVPFQDRVEVKKNIYTKFCYGTSFIYSTSTPNFDVAYFNNY